MSDLIRRSDAIEAIEVVDWYHQNRNKDMVSGANDNEHQAWYKAEDVYKALEEVPSVDRPQGEWIFHSEWEEHWCRYECSLCGRTFDYEMNYCGFCGSPMKGARR